MSKTKKNKKEKYAVLFGFNIRNKDKTGYLKIDNTGYTIVKDHNHATIFSLDHKPGKGTPHDWCEFFKTEPTIMNWRFHPVILIK